MRTHKIETLDLSCNNITNKGATAILKEFKEDKKLLTKLTLAGNNEIDDEMMSEIEDYALRNQALDSKYSYWNPPSNKKISRTIIDGIVGNNHITEIHFQNNRPLRNDLALYLFTVLKNNTNIIKMYLPGNELDDKPIEALIELLKSKNNITTIDLSDNRLTNVGALLLLKRLEGEDGEEKNKTLIKLCLTGNKIICDEDEEDEDITSKIDNCIQRNIKEAEKAKRIQSNINIENA